MFLQRFIYAKTLQHLNQPEVTVITGMRRTGKTTLLRKLYDDVPSENKAFVDLENRIYRELFILPDYDEIWLNLQRTYHFTSGSQAYIFLDEIQYIRDLPSVLKYLVDHYHVKCVVTGSSSFYLKHLFSESLAGRKQIFELFPLTFSEFLVFKGRESLPGDEPNIVDIQKSDWFQRKYATLFEEYSWFGGFPEVVLQDDEDRKKFFLKDVFYSYIERDVRAISGFRKITELEQVIRLLVGRIGQKLDVAKISRETGLARLTLTEYLSFLEKTYVVSFITPFTQNVGKEISKAPKVYFCDNGLANRLSPLSAGQSLENIVFHHLKVKHQSPFAVSPIRYYQKKTGTEIDFILNQQVAIEVKETVTDTAERRLAALCSQLGIHTWRLVSRNLATTPNTLYASQI
jgi:hypothetical protein